MSRPRHLLRLLPLLLLTPLAAVQLTPTPPDAAALPEGPGRNLAPYLQAVDQTGATLMFETATAQAVTVTVSSATDAAPLASCLAPPARLHQLRLSDLSPGTNYAYAVTGPAGESLGEGRFATWPEDLSTLRFFAYGDTRTRPDEHRKITERMAAMADGHLFVLHSGDLVADGRQYDQWKDQFFDPAATLFAKLPVIPVPGNHERGSELFRTYFDLPQPEWYGSLRAGPVHVTLLDNYRDLNPDDWQTTPQGQFLLADLQAAQAAPWRIAMFHTPIYSLGPHGKLNDDGLPREAPMRWARQTLEPLLREAGYQLTINGHDHVYERSEKDGLTMLTAGGGGAPTYSQGPAEQNPFSRRFVVTTHFCDFTVTADRLDCKVYNADGELLDSFTLDREP